MYWRASLQCENRCGNQNANSANICYLFALYGSLRNHSFEPCAASDWLCPRQWRRPEFGFAVGCLTKGRLQEDIFRQDDGIPNGSSRLGSTDGISSPWRRAGSDRIEPHDALLDQSAGNGAIAGAKKVNLVSLRENIDTSTATGRCFLSMMGAIHQMERELRAERASVGRASAKARGKTGGRPRTDILKLENAKVLYENSG